jgi:hypothetical protein
MVDYIGLTLRNLAHVNSNNINDRLKFMSFLISLFLLSCFIMEIIFGYYQANSLYLISKGKKTPIESDLRRVYYEGLDRKSIKTSWWVRNYNLIFTTKFIIVSVFIYTLQYLQIVQVMFSLVLLTIIFIFTTIKSFKLKFFKSKFTKYIRVFQEFSFALILIFIGTFFMDKMNNSTLKDKSKYNLVLTIIIVVVVNVLMELVVILKEILSAINKKFKKPKNKVAPQHKVN